MRIFLIFALTFYIAEADADSYTLSRTISNPSPTQSRNFGVAIAIDENLLIVGSSIGTENNSFGQAFLFDLTTGHLLHTFEYPDKSCQADTWFGSRVSIGDGKVLVSDFPDAIFCGLFPRVHQYDTLTGTYDRTYDAGWTGIIGSQIAIVGGWSNTFLFDLDTGDGLGEFQAGFPLWAAEDLVLTGRDLYDLTTNSLTAQFSSGGFAGSFDSDYVVFGDPIDNEKASIAGKVKIFNIHTEELVREIFDPMPLPHRRFGDNVVIQNGKILISRRGKAYLFGIGGELLHTFEPLSTSTSEFGSRVAMSGDSIVIGDRTAGEVHVYTISESSPLSSYFIPLPILFNFVLGVLVIFLVHDFIQRRPL